MAARTSTEKEHRGTILIIYRDLKVKYAGLTDWVETQALDLTPEGLFLNTPRELRTGTRVKLQFELVRTGVLIQTMAEVQYCLSGLGAGVEFVDLPVYAHAAIVKELEEPLKSSPTGIARRPTNCP
jgi:hypothetical protein